MSNDESGIAIKKYDREWKKKKKKEKKEEKREKRKKTTKRGQATSHTGRKESKTKKFNIQFSKKTIDKTRQNSNAVNLSDSKLKCQSDRTWITKNEGGKNEYFLTKKERKRKYLSRNQSEITNADPTYDFVYNLLLS